MIARSGTDNPRIIPLYQYIRFLRTPFKRNCIYSFLLTMPVCFQIPVKADIIGTVMKTRTIFRFDCRGIRIPLKFSFSCESVAFWLPYLFLSRILPMCKRFAQNKQISERLFVRLEAAISAKPLIITPFQNFLLSCLQRVLSSSVAACSFNRE